MDTKRIAQFGIGLFGFALLMIIVAAVTPTPSEAAGPGFWEQVGIWLSKPVASLEIGTYILVQFLVTVLGSLCALYILMRYITKHVNL